MTAAELIRSDSDDVLADRISTLETDRNAATVPAGAEPTPDTEELVNAYNAEILRLREARRMLQEEVGESV